MRDWTFSVTVNDVSAAERLKNVAPGASPGHAWRGTLSPEGATDVRRLFRPSGAGFKTNTNPGLAPGATFLRRSAKRKRDSAQPQKIDRRYGESLVYVWFLYVTVILKCSA